MNPAMKASFSTRQIIVCCAPRGGEGQGHIWDQLLLYVARKRLGDNQSY